MFKKCIKGVLLVLFSFSLAMTLHAQYNALYSFLSGTANGAFPKDAPIFVGSGLYGVTSSGGASSKGTIYKVNKDGTGYTLLHSFSGDDGAYPYGMLVCKGKTLYGTTPLGGVSNWGVIFKINTDGTGFAVLHLFDVFASGLQPWGALTCKGSVLYGMTNMGAGGMGTIYKINTNGTGFTTLHSFMGGTADGSYPFTNSLVFKGPKLYGMTQMGGASGQGVIFRMNSNGTGYALLHSFSGATGGDCPLGKLAFKGAAIFGLASKGGANDKGVIFKAKADGSGFTVLHEFTGGTADGASPTGALTVKGIYLYGVTSAGGIYDKGTIFNIKADGTGFVVLHSFGGGAPDGVIPQGSLILKNSILYGTTQYGGTADTGSIFSYSLKKK